jgi:hypothetical protein
MTAIFIFYDWTTNAILATPVKDGKADTTIATFEAHIQYLTKWGFTPTLNIIGNVAIQAIQSYIETNDIKVQLVQPHNHRVNAVEQAIQTFKNHMISGLSTCDEQFPSLLWDRIIPRYGFAEHATHLPIIGISCARRGPRLQPDPLGTTRHKSNHFQPSRNRDIMGPPRH